MVADTEIKNYKKIFIENEIHFAKNISAPTTAQEGTTDQNRNSIIIKNNTSQPISKHLGPKKAFLEEEYKKSAKMKKLH